MDLVGIGKLVLEIIGLCAVIAKMTPWEWDDQAIGWVIKLIRFLGFQKTK